jgi:hypothetical protein
MGARRGCRKLCPLSRRAPRHRQTELNHAEVDAAGGRNKGMCLPLASPRLGLSRCVTTNTVTPLVVLSVLYNILGDPKSVVKTAEAQRFKLDSTRSLLLVHWQPCWSWRQLAVAARSRGRGR